MKLNDENPEQHLAIVFLGGLFLVINLIAAYKSHNKEAANHPEGPQQMVTQIVDEQGNVFNQPTMHQNPSLSWTELIFCRGLKRSTWCSNRERHPDTVEADEVGVEVVSQGRKQDHVVAYRGPMTRESIFSSRVSIPDPDISNKYRDIESTKEVGEGPSPEATGGE